MTRPELHRYTAAMRYPIAALALLPDLALADIADSARVIEGHTIEISRQRIRLGGIDAPERRQTCRQNVVALPTWSAKSGPGISESPM